MSQAAQQNEAREKILEALGLAGDACETCELAVELLTSHEPIGCVVMIRADIAQAIVGALQAAAGELRPALDGVCERLEKLPEREE